MIASVPARVALACGFLSATIAYGAWTTLRTALDPNATDEVAAELFESRVVQETIADELREQITQTANVGTLEPEATAAIDEALTDPRIAEAFSDAVIAMHAALLEGRDGRITLDVNEVTASVRDALAASDPALAAQIGQSRPIQLDLGDPSLPAIDRADDRVRQILVFATLLAVAFLALGVAIHPSQRDALARIGRRVALLAVGPAIAFVVLPWILELSGNDAAEIAGSVLDVYGGRVLPSAVVLAIGGVALWIGARTWPGGTGEHDALGYARPAPLDPYATTNERAAQQKMYL